MVKRTMSSSLGEFGAHIDLLSKTYGAQDLPQDAHRVLLVYPRIRIGDTFVQNVVKAKLQLEEAVTLVNTLPKFTVVQTMAVSTDQTTKKKHLWGSGRIDRVQSMIQKVNATTLVFDVDILSPLQQTELYSIFKLPIYDRYNIVLNIFKVYARTKEAKLQIRLAEIPYMKKRLLMMHNLGVSSNILHLERASTTKSVRENLDMLRMHEHKLRKRLKAVLDEKADLRLGEAQKNVATTVAVVGYTNAGKSSLIKRLTGRDIFVEDRLFATLDTSLHRYRLPSGVSILFADTIGFISNLPTQLLASFQATLSHVANADLLLHVEDVSNPDYLTQRETVISTLRKLRISKNLIETMVRVGNKIDLINFLPENDDMHLISCADGRGLMELITAIDKRVIALRGSVIRRLKLRPNSQALVYLKQNSFIAGQPIASEDNEYIVCNVLMTDDEFGKFTANFKLNKIKPES